MADIADFLVDIEMGFYPDFDTDGTYIGKSTRKHKPQNKVNGVVKIKLHYNYLII